MVINHGGKTAGTFILESFEDIFFYHTFLASILLTNGNKYSWILIFFVQTIYCETNYKFVQSEVWWNYHWVSYYIDRVKPDRFFWLERQLTSNHLLVLKNGTNSINFQNIRKIFFYKHHVKLKNRMCIMKKFYVCFLHISTIDYNYDYVNKV